MMLSYGRLPDGYMMLNWPQGGNDIYLEYLDMPREEVYRQAKNRTLGYIYYLQNELGFKNLGADRIVCRLARRKKRGTDDDA